MTIVTGLPATVLPAPQILLVDFREPRFASLTFTVLPAPQTHLVSFREPRFAGLTFAVIAGSTRNLTTGWLVTFA